MRTFSPILLRNRGKNLSSTSVPDLCHTIRFISCCYFRLRLADIHQQIAMRFTLSSPIFCSQFTDNQQRTTKNQQLSSILFESSHPLGPVLRLDSAGHGPGSGCVKFRMPLERPVLLYAHLSHRPVLKELVIAATAVTVQADHLDAAYPPINATCSCSLPPRGVWKKPRTLEDHGNALDHRGQSDSQRPPEFQRVRLSGR